MHVEVSRTLHARGVWWIVSYLYMWLGEYVHWWTLANVVIMWNCGLEYVYNLFCNDWSMIIFMLLSREWIHGVGAVPSTMHQRLSIWREDGLLENIEADQCYFLAEANNITKKNFDKQLTSIPPCISLGPGYEVQPMKCSLWNSIQMLALFGNGKSLIKIMWWWIMKKLPQRKRMCSGQEPQLTRSWLITLLQIVPHIRSHQLGGM